MRALLVAFFAALLVPGVAHAGETSSIVVDAASGEVLHADRPLDPWRPASLTKVMTVYLAFEALQSGALRLGDRLTVSARAEAQPPTELGLEAGDRISVEEAIAAVIVRSANDAAVVLAEALAGSEAVFAELMTFRARDLGMRDTVFRNATGLPNDGQVTNARDMALLAIALLHDFPRLYGVFSTRSVSFRGADLPTYNGLLVSYRGADGIKTGFTCASGYNLLASAVRGGRRLVAVVLGGRSRSERAAEMHALLDRGFAARSGRPEDAALLDDLAKDVTPERIAPGPPQVLDPEACNPEPEIAVVQRGKGNAGVQALVGPNAGSGSSWGVTLGAFPAKAEARSRVETAQAKLRTVSAKARPLLVERKVGPMTRFTALLTGMTQTEAVQSCRLLQSTKSYCVTLGPQALKNPKALWW